jgi:uncharacterized membrane protein
MAETSGKKEAQERVDRIHAFRRELAQLAQEGVVVFSEEQRSRLDAHLDQTLAKLAGSFDVDVSESQKQISLAMRIASALGGLAFGAAVFLFFYRYWGLLTTPLQVTILVAVPLLLLVLTEWVSRRERTLYYTSLLAVVVFIAFVLDLNVMGAIFNMTPSHNAFLAWGLFALALAYAYRLRLQLAAGVVSLAIFLAACLMILGGGSWMTAVERPETFLPGGIALFAVPAVLRHEKQPGFPAVYRLFGMLFVFLGLLVLANAGQLTFLPLARKPVQGIYQVAGFAASAAAIWMGVRRKMPECVNLGSAFFAIYLFNRVFSWWWDWMPKYLLFLIVGLIALALLAVFRRIRSGALRKEEA